MQEQIYLMIISMLKYNNFKVTPWAESSSKTYPRSSPRRKFMNISPKWVRLPTAKWAERTTESPGGLLSLALSNKILLRKSSHRLITLIWVPAKSKSRSLGSEMKNLNLERGLKKRNNLKREAKRKRKRLKSLRTLKKLSNRSQKSLGTT